MALAQASASLNINLEYTWADGGTWDDNPQVHWGPMLECDATVFNNTQQIQGTVSVSVQHTLESSTDNIVRGRHSVGEYVDQSYSVSDYVENYNDNIQNIVTGTSALRFRGSPVSLSTTIQTQASALRLRGSPITLTTPNIQLSVGKRFRGSPINLTVQASLSASTNNTVRGSSTLDTVTSIPNAGGGRLTQASLSMSLPAITLSAGVLRLVLQNLKRTYYIEPFKTVYTIKHTNRVNTLDVETRSYQLPKLTRNIEVQKEIREYATNYRF